MRTVIAILSLALAMIVLPACSGGGYALQGRIIRGDYSAVTIVEADDPRLASGQGIPGVAMHLQHNPGQLNRRTLIRGSSGGDGSFSLPVDLVGAGVFQHDVGLFVRRQGYEPATGYFRLPPKSKRVLIILNHGTDRDLGEDGENLYDEYERFRGGP